MPTLKNKSKHHIVLINGVDYSQKGVKICLSDVRPRGAYVVMRQEMEEKYKLL